MPGGLGEAAVARDRDERAQRAEGVEATVKASYTTAPAAGRHCAKARGVSPGGGAFLLARVSSS